jgi:hypothetical protein
LPSSLWPCCLLRCVCERSAFYAIRHDTGATK